MSGERYLLLAITIMAIATVATRALPFLALRADTKHPLVLYLGRYLPPAVMTLLIIYCVRDVSLTIAPYGLPHWIAIAFTAALHLWRGNALLSIGAGTALFIWLSAGA